jgi:hypothetical protein
VKHRSKQESLQVYLLISELTPPGSSNRAIPIRHATNIMDKCWNARSDLIAWAVGKGGYENAIGTRHKVHDALRR